MGRDHFLSFAPHPDKWSSTSTSGTYSEIKIIQNIQIKESNLKSMDPLNLLMHPKVEVICKLAKTKRVNGDTMGCILRGLRSHGGRIRSQTKNRLVQFCQIALKTFSGPFASKKLDRITSATSTNPFETFTGSRKGPLLLGKKYGIFFKRLLAEFSLCPPSL